MLKTIKNCNCYTQDIELALDIVSDWAINPVIKRKFQKLQQEVEILEKQIKMRNPKISDQK
ncbi:hypothetical protein G7B40_020915 [Aetokthonos hydrillicola Thurmond2011]|jgi:predicted Zn-dependent peptidase|uniref:Uncharacterized protein n=1 Tax=Aetokthonos hydrillicola Thurmond2011 TaxID=2712845 RepID=A0AAP5IB30_9CYAN|nr:hypothetical protein [Aetokthonos hydrillicola]MBO3458686.1 hypothetical protein [Aetokthonos hydrillicola CCALA 1050]MBW4588039.1 hypothetical protein [Aetokthonos hydrillicola CCALA 1050]MDR9897009.1 hypothetical protein [Aetokthonos hydrillicola Thurmond2011]